MDPPHQGASLVVPIAAFLALRETYQLEGIGRVASTLAGAQQY